MGKSVRHAQTPDSSDVPYWLFRALICLVIAPLIGLMVGILGAVAGMMWGELAAVLVLAIFLIDIFVRLARNRRLRTPPRPGPVGVWDQDLDG